MHGIDSARELMTRQIVTTPPSLELYLKMAEMELNQSQVDVSKSRKCYEEIVRLFGAKNYGKIRFLVYNMMT